MNIEWKADRENNPGCYVNGHNMGWVEKGDEGMFTVLCTYMREPSDDRVLAGRLLPTQYPEGALFPTLEQAKQELAVHAMVAYMGGWRNTL